MAWFLNSNLSQKYFISSKEGTSLPYISRKSLEGLEVFIPGIEKQKKILKANNLQIKKQRLLEEKITLEKLLTSNILEKKLLGEI